MPNNTPAPEAPCSYVGIFWFVRDDDATAMIAEKVPVARAASYGEFATLSRGHYQHWQSLKAMGPSALKRAGLPVAPAWYEYEEFPRGRVVFHRPTGRTTVYLDRKLNRPAYLNVIALTFGLSDEFEVAYDPHYLSTQFL